MASSRAILACLLTAACLLALGCGRELGEACEVLSGGEITGTLIETRNYHCASEICIGNSDSGYCSRRCETDADCLPGMYCEDLTFDPIVADWICMYE